jgi:hypothetical protein
MSFRVPIRRLPHLCNRILSTLFNYAAHCLGYVALAVVEWHQQGKHPVFGKTVEWHLSNIDLTWIALELNPAFRYKGRRLAWSITLPFLLFI